MMEVTRYWSQDGLLVIGIAAPASRAEARVLLRQAVRTAAAQWLNMDIDSIAMESTPGQAPRLLLAGRAVGLSFSHDKGISLAAIGLHGPVGIDVMQVADIADWENVARDYLGPRVAGELMAIPTIQRPLRLAQAWTAREAALKCAGLPLVEWNGAAPARRLQALAVPAPYVATLAY